MKRNQRSLQTLLRDAYYNTPLFYAVLPFELSFDLSKWFGKEVVAWPFLAIQAIKAYEPILMVDGPEIQAYYSELFGTALPPPRILWGKGPSYNARTDRISLRLTPNKPYKDGKSFGDEESRTEVICHEEAHRYHFHANPHLMARHSNGGGHETFSEFAVKSTYAEGVATAAQVKTLEELGFTELSQFYREKSKRHHPPYGPDNLSTGYVARHLLEQDNTRFRDFVQADVYDAMASASKAWRDLKNTEIHVYMSGPYI